MASWLEYRQGDFAVRFAALLDTKRESAQDVVQAVAAIIADIRTRGDQALLEYTHRLDHVQLSTSQLILDLDQPVMVDSRLDHALDHAKERLLAFHARHKPSDDWYTDAKGVGLGARWTPVDAVALYTPGGKAAYPSSLLMNAVPALVAGVERIVLATPTSAGHINPAIIAAARKCGLREAYRIGGAQAIAALAYGTASIRPVDKIVGPGNAYVAAAKRQVFGQVGIDSIAGPSEVVILADGANNPDWIAIDLLAQAEHDEAAQSILITDDQNFARAVMAAIERELATLTRAQTASASWRDHGAIIIVDRLDQGLGLIDRLAPEHLQIAAADARALANSVRHAGAIFLGAYTPEAIGDYLAGPNHVLPTSRTARFASGLSVLDFMKRTTLIECAADALSALSQDALALAEAEGLTAHARSITIRTNR